MLTLGVDLASAAAKTAWCLMEWRAGAASVLDVQVGADDSQLLDVASRADHVGIDAPLGWPSAFVEMLQQDPRPMAWPEERDALRYRATDHFVKAVTGLWPLSVSSDLIGVVAMRCRGLLAQLAAIEKRCLEVYPAACLHQWGFASRGYKGVKGRLALRSRVDEVLAAAPYLRLGDDAAVRVRASDDAFDAMLASMSVRAYHAGHVLAEHLCPDDGAAKEGWIVLPSPGSIGRLA